MPARTWRRRAPRVQASSAARGYGSTHKKLAAALLAIWQPGDPCTRCGRPMWQRWMVTGTGRRVSAIHLGHNDDRTGYRGLEHARCNTSAGASEGNRARVTDASRNPTVRHSRAW